MRLRGAPKRHRNRPNPPILLEVAPCRRRGPCQPLEAGDLGGLDGPRGRLAHGPPRKWPPCTAPGSTDRQLAPPPASPRRPVDPSPRRRAARRPPFTSSTGSTRHSSPICRPARRRGRPWRAGFGGAGNPPSCRRSVCARRPRSGRPIATAATSSCAGAGSRSAAAQISSLRAPAITRGPTCSSRIARNSTAPGAACRRSM